MFDMFHYTNRVYENLNAYRHCNVNQIYYLIYSMYNGLYIYIYVIFLRFFYSFTYIGHLKKLPLYLKIITFSLKAIFLKS